MFFMLRMYTTSVEVYLRENSMHFSGSLAKNSPAPDADGLFATRQITDVVFGGLSEEKLLTQR